MTREEFERLEKELKTADTLYDEEYDTWFKMVGMARVEENCRTGWMVWRIKKELDKGASNNGKTQ